MTVYICQETDWIGSTVNVSNNWKIILVTGSLDYARKWSYEKPGRKFTTEEVLYPNESYNKGE